MTNTQMRIRAIGYSRVSTEKQAGQGISLEAQAEKIKAMAVVQGAELVAIITDGGESAKTLNRPGMQRLLEQVNSGDVDTIIIAKLDRLTRSVKDLAELLEAFEKRGVSLVSVADSLDTKTAAGRLVLNIMMSVSQWEREAIGERTKDAMQHKKQNRKVYNHAPLGFVQQGGDLVENREEMKIVWRIREMRQHSSLAGIAEALNRENVPTKTGRKWHPFTISKILSNSLYESVQG